MMYAMVWGRAWLSLQDSESESESERLRRVTGYTSNTCLLARFSAQAGEAEARRNHMLASEEPELLR